ncbi:hypothetical protein JCGZ_26487 [Jatropha curcas]|uniref:Uncharacterized protein n=1 Tax=Jatropha curcas TaxID=180498 RepID=A0A067L4P8_JATCU|nr:hypothetical protein JCGZ_26487 [Jatropha curcas]
MSITLELQEMETSSPAIFVNGETLQMYTGKKVRAVVQVIECDGGNTIVKSTDEHEWIVKELPLPSVPLLNYIEVIGVAETNKSIRAELCTDFGNTFDAQSYNQLCKLANGEHKALFL